MVNYKKLLRVSLRETTKTLFGTKRGIGSLTSKTINTTLGQVIQGKKVNTKGLNRITKNFIFGRNVVLKSSKRNINRSRRLARFGQPLNTYKTNT
jgi:hypothetical protein